jgi:hypothetical protein
MPSITYAFELTEEQSSKMPLQAPVKTSPENMGKMLMTGGDQIVRMAYMPRFAMSSLFLHHAESYIGTQNGLTTYYFVFLPPNDKKETEENRDVFGEICMIYRGKVEGFQTSDGDITLRFFDGQLDFDDQIVEDAIVKFEKSGQLHLIQA